MRRPLLALLLLGAAQPAAAESLTRTTVGTLRGTVEKGVEAYRGVPYAAGPVGPLRWRAPQPFPAWTGVRDATRFAPACAQGVPGTWGPYTAEFLAQPPISEDCLALNVWKPAGTRHGLPVLVFIHGGGFGGGAGSLPIYDGAALAARGAVVVTINYRVGVFGFLAHPALSAEDLRHRSGNYGLLDQIAALRWVRANVAAFGGDPANVTIAGESAGAASVNDLMLMPLARGLFQRAVAFSGAGMGIALPSLREGEENGTALGKAMNAPTPEALRAQSADSLIEATKYTPGKDAGPPKLIFVPHLDGTVVPADAEVRGARVVTNVPLLTGFNATEMIDPSIRTPVDFERAVRGRYGAFADRLLALYPHGDAAAVARSSVLISRDRYMTGMLLWARARAQSANQPIYAYLYDHPYPPAPGGMSYGAFHTSQLPYVFGNLGQGGRVFDPADRVVSRAWQDRLLAFMRSGNPSVPGGRWARIDARSAIVMGLGDKPGPRPAVSSPARFEAFKAFAANGGRLGLM